MPRQQTKKRPRGSANDPTDCCKGQSTDFTRVSVSIVATSLLEHAQPLSLSTQASAKVIEGGESTTGFSRQKSQSRAEFRLVCLTSIFTQECHSPEQPGK